MHQKKVIILLKTFLPEERKAFDSFVVSPFFNKNARIITLWKCLQKFAPDFHPEKLTQDVAHSAVFKDMEFQEKRLDRLLQKLLKIVEAFIVHYQIKQKTEISSPVLLDWLASRKVNRLFEQNAKAFETWLHEKDPERYEFEYERFQLERGLSNYLHREKEYAKGDVNLESAMVALDHYYLVEKLIMATAMYNRQSLLPVDYDLGFIPDIEVRLESNPEAFSPSVRLWYKAFRLVKSQHEPERYFELKRDLLERIDRIGEKDGSALFFILQNSMRKGVNSQSIAYFQELFDLYKTQIQQGWIFLEDGSIQMNLFKNIVTVGTTLGEVEWTRDFIERFTAFLPEEERADILGYAHAMLAFEQADYAQVLKLLAPLSRTNIFFDLSIRRIMLKVYYERSDTESLFSQINTYRVFLHRLDKVADYFKAANISFLNILSALSRIRFSETDKQSEKLVKLIDELAETADLPERTWLNAKIQALS